MSRLLDDERLISLSEEVLQETRTSLMMRFRFMDIALWHMPFVPAHNYRTLKSDGESLFFDPLLTVQQFRADPNEQIRDMLHVILHCVFRHPFDTSHSHFESWSLCCDILIEEIAIEMCEGRFPSALDEARLDALEDLRKQVGELTPVSLYNYLALSMDNRLRSFKQKTASKEYVEALQYLFIRDEHSPWPMRDIYDNTGDAHHEQDNQKNKDRARPEDQDEDDRFDPDDDRETEQSDELGRTDVPDPPDFDQDDSRDQDQDDIDLEDLEQRAREWADIAKSMETDLDAFTGNIDEAQKVLVALARANRKRVDYRDFLRQFASYHEEIKVNDDEFDYIFYAYGLQRYGNMPIVEPLEYQETKRVRDFVIALDTSGSTQGETVKNFVQLTFDILKETEGFGSKVNVHLIQCDAAVRKDDKISSLDELKRYMDTFEISGGGTTDFNPVFEYVDELMAQREFDDLCGLIYFTDGMGRYPQRPTSYKTAFVFLETGDTGMCKVPPWAMRVLIGAEEIRSTAGNDGESGR